MELEVGDIVMCTVDKIVGTMVFVKIDNNGDGSIILSEIAPGRIRNLRDYVVPKKRIVCKILRISGDRIDLSLRRVTPKDKKEVLEREKQEKSCRGVLKGVLGEKANEVIQKILDEEQVYDFCERIKEDTKDLEKYAGKENAKKIQDILMAQKPKKAIVKRVVALNSNQPNGLNIIKEILGKIKNAEVKYISAGKYSLKVESSDPKTADNKLKSILEDVEKQAKTDGLIFSIVKR